MTKDEAFRAWCTRNGTAQEALAYDIWCAAWEEATAKERKECAKLCKKNMFYATGEQHAEAITARGNT